MRFDRAITAFITILIICTPAAAQISDSLYNALPQNIKPKNRLAITAIEKQKILVSASSFNAPFYRPELGALCTSLTQQSSIANPSQPQVENLKAVAEYYNGYRSDSAVYFNRKLIAAIPGDKQYSQLLSRTFLNLAIAYVYLDNYDSAMACLQAGSNSANFNDTELHRDFYGVYGVLYNGLQLYDSSIFYGQKIIRSYPSNTQWTIEYVDHLLNNAVGYAHLFKETHIRSYADSAYTIINNVMRVKKSDGEHWFNACYYFLGFLDYLNNNYIHAVSMFDSSALPYYNRVSLYNANNYYGKYLYKAVCLIKMKRYKEGKDILDTLIIGKANFTNKQVKFQALYEQAEGTGNYKDAFLYYKQYKLYSDSLDLQGQRGRIFESEQKYSAARKDANIAILQNKNEKQTNERNQIIAWAAFTILLFVITVIILYNRTQRQKMQKELELANQRKIISANMHDEVNSGLAALRYLVADLKDRVSTDEAKTVLTDLEEETLNVYTQSRNFMHQINGSEISEDHDVVKLLLKLQMRFNDASGLKINALAEEQNIHKYFTQQQHIELSRIIKEAVANAMKYSGAKLINIIIQKKGWKFYFEIKDNGAWVENIDGSSGIGLAALHQHIEALNGKAQVKGGPNGTIISGSFPVKNNKWWQRF